MTGQNWSVLLGWTLLVVLAYPLLTLAVAEWSRRLGSGRASLLRSLRVVQILLLPSLAAWLIVDKLTTLGSDSLLVKLVDTTFGIAILYALLVFAQGALTFVVARASAPRLFYDIALSILVIIGAAVIVSTVWGFSLTSLLSAVGIGSVVMGLALQSVIGGTVSSILLLSARQFAIGDWLRIGNNVGKVIEIDWRSVTLELSPTERLVLPSASLASGGFVVTGAAQSVSASVNVSFGYQHSPERVRNMLLEAARGVPQLTAPDRAACRVSEFGAAGITYVVFMPVAEPTRIPAAKDELLSRIWYASQRFGMSIAPLEHDIEARNNLPTYGITAEQRAELLAATGVFRRPASALLDVAEDAQLQRWRPGEVILRQGESTHSILVIVRGAVCMFVHSGTARIEMDCLGAGQVFAIREAFRDGASPVDVVVSTETELLAIPAQALQRLLDKDHRLAADLETIVEARNQALANLSALPTPQQAMVA